MKTPGNVVKGESSYKIHLRVGSGTRCKKNTLNKETENEFIRIYRDYPEVCCSKCANYLKQRNKL